MISSLLIVNVGELTNHHWKLFCGYSLIRGPADVAHLTRQPVTPIGVDKNPIEPAVNLAKSAPLPEPRGFRDERIRLLAGICREMQVLTGDNPFFVSTRKVGEILGVHWTQAGRWLRILEKPLQVIHLAPGEVRKRGGIRCPRYYYGPPTRAAKKVSIAKPLAICDGSLVIPEKAA
jgi:hypothetical protein